MEVVVEERGVEEQSGRQGHERQAQARAAAARAAPGSRRRRPPTPRRRCPPTSRFRPRWLASWAAVKAPTPAKVAWHSESWPAMPVISVMESRTIESVRPLLKTVVPRVGHPGQHGHEEAGEEDPPQDPDDAVHAGRPASSPRSGAVVGRSWPEGHGSSRGRACPGRKSSAATITRNGSDGHDRRVEEAVRRDVALQHRGHHADEDAPPRPRSARSAAAPRRPPQSPSP